MENLDLYRKAYGGAGAYTLDEEDSAEACALAGCGGNPVRRTEGADGVGVAALRPPPNGWGEGVANGWMDKSGLKFNAAAQAAFGRPPPPPGEPLLLVFGGASVTDMLRNWALHVRKLKMGYAVACMDAPLFNLANEIGVPAVMMAAGDGDRGAVSTRWKYYRMDPKAFMQMGILMVRPN